MKLIRLLWLPLILTLSACTASITQQAFITQHDTVAEYSPELLNQWRQWLPGLEVNSLSMTAEDGVLLKGIYLDNPHARIWCCTLPAMAWLSPRLPSGGYRA